MPKNRKYPNESKAQFKKRQAKQKSGKSKGKKNPFANLGK